VAQLVGNTLLVVTTLLAIACVVYYHVSSGGTWRFTEVGRHLQAFMGSCALVLTLSVLRVFGGASLATPWFAAVRTVALSTVTVAFGWRLSIMIRANRRGRSGGGEGRGVRVSGNGDRDR
jgi:FlaA1/EpsC-like NDP-sugar epimerase